LGAALSCLTLSCVSSAKCNQHLGSSPVGYTIDTTLSLCVVRLESWTESDRTKAGIGLKSSFELRRGEITQSGVNLFGHVLHLQPVSKLPESVVEVEILRIVDMFLLQSTDAAQPGRSRSADHRRHADKRGFGQQAGIVGRGILHPLVRMMGVGGRVMGQRQFQSCHGQGFLQAAAEMPTAQGAGERIQDDAR
jgi:hypothetical protein